MTHEGVYIVIGVFFCIAAVVIILAVLKAEKDGPEARR